jgi:hypothetical protein
LKIHDDPSVGVACFLALRFCSHILPIETDFKKCQNQTNALVCVYVSAGQVLTLPIHQRPIFSAGTHDTAARSGYKQILANA